MTALLGAVGGPEVDVSPAAALVTVLALVAMAAVGGFFLTRPELWRRLWFDRVDPRPAALMRIFFGTIVLVNFAGLLWPSGPLEHSVARHLFTDEGLWLTELARQNYGGELRTLWDPEHGFQRWTDPLRVLWGNFTVLHFRSDPGFAFPLYAAMLGSLVLMIAGWRTRAATVVAWVLVETFYRYNPIFYTGSDNVVRVFLFLGMLTQWGEAYSLDSLRRRRRAILEEGASALPALRKIPAWPLRLMMLQLCCIYTATGLLKSGSTWQDGTALYFALNLDHFYRLPQTHVVTWAHHFGVLPALTALVRWFEIAFPLAAVGVVLNAWERERAAGCWPQAPTWRRTLGVAWLSLAWAALAIVLGIAAFFTLPHRVPSDWSQTQVVLLVAAMTLPLPAAVAMAYLGLRRFLPRVHRFTRHWLLGKRSWLFFGLGMHIGIGMSLNVGTFAEVMVATYCVWLRGEDLDAFWRWVGSRRARPGENGRPQRSRWEKLLLLPVDALRYRRPAPKPVVLHHPDDASVRRAALLRLLDVAGRLVFEPDDASAPESLRVRLADGRVVAGNAAAAALTAIFPALWPLRPVSWLPGVGALVRGLLSQRPEPASERDREAEDPPPA
ncbi:MAG: hypothetical protein MJE66_18755 [Proteobacteria bacterium]|nr:hypothetical protein [Pseudomonadota bacterium]